MTSDAARGVAWPATLVRVGRELLAQRERYNIQGAQGRAKGQGRIGPCIRPPLSRPRFNKRGKCVLRPPRVDRSGNRLKEFRPVTGDVIAVPPRTTCQFYRSTPPQTHLHRCKHTNQTAPPDAVLVRPPASWGNAPGRRRRQRRRRQSPATKHATTGWSGGLALKAVV